MKDLNEMISDKWIRVRVKEFHDLYEQHKLGILNDDIYKISLSALNEKLHEALTNEDE